MCTMYISKNCKNRSLKICIFTQICWLICNNNYAKFLGWKLEKNLWSYVFNKSIKMYKNLSLSNQTVQAFPYKPCPIRQLIEQLYRSDKD